MLVQEVSAGGQLLSVKHAHELHVFDCAVVGAFDCNSVLALGVVEALPQRERGAHWRSDEHIRCLIVQHLEGFDPLALAIEVPGLTILWV